MSEFDAYQALSFDCYGTLIDWEGGLAQSMQPWAASHGIDLGPAELVAVYGTHEHVVQTESPAMPYPDVLAESLRRVARQLGADATDDELADFGASVGAWPAFADSAAALRRLQERFALIILSNIDRASFARSNRRLGVTFDLVLTAQDIGSYKPDQRNFDALFASLGDIGVARGELLHVAQSLFHDHAPAQRNQLPAVWIDRYHRTGGWGATPATDVTVTHRFTTLAAFADAALGSSASVASG